MRKTDYRFSVEYSYVIDAVCAVRPTMQFITLSVHLCKLHRRSNCINCINDIQCRNNLNAKPIICFANNAPFKKGKVFPYSLPSVGPGADPGVQAVSPQVT